MHEAKSPSRSTPPNEESEEQALSRGTSALGVTRRRLLVAGAASAAAGMLGAGVFATHRACARYASATEATVRDHRVTFPLDRPKLVIARGTDPVRNVDGVLAELGGMKAFVKHGDVVLIKPNIAWERTPAYAANTDPRVVAAVVRACKDAGADEIIVTDCPCHEPERTFRMSGIRAAAEAEGAKVILPDALRHRMVRVSKRLGTWEVLEAFTQADKLINVPIAKHHGSARITAGLKNWIGITLRSRPEFHASLDESIAELAALMRPTLTIVDATRVLLRNGPKGGNLGDVREENAVGASVDPVAVDAWAAELLGAKVSAVGYIALAEKNGLGTANYRSLSPRTLRT